MALLRRHGRPTYRTIQRQFHLDDAALEDLKDELIYGQRVAADEEGRMLAWTGQAKTLLTSTLLPLAPRPGGSPAQPPPPLVLPSTPEAERRQLTVLFCDLVDSTTLASRPGDAGHPHPLRSPPGRSDDSPLDGWQGPACGGGEADRGQDGRGAPVCRRARQDGLGVRAHAGGGRTLCAGRPAAPPRRFPQPCRIR